jgi:transglutaminase-like putative cysteine protease
MNQRHGVALAAGTATLMAAAPMSTVFGTWNWALYCAFAIAAVTGAAIAARALRARLWVQVLAMLGALTIMMTWLAHAPHAFLGTVPTRGTLRAFGELLSGATADIQRSGLPVPDSPGLLFMTALGIGLVAVAVDLFAVGLRRPALAGFPMLAIYAIPVFVHGDSVSPVPFVIGATGFLWLLVADNVDRVRRFGRRFTGDGRGVDVWEPSPLAAAGRRLTVLGVAVAVVLPLVVPGMTNGILSQANGFGNGPGRGPGIRGTSTVNLFADLAGRLQQDKTSEMVKVSTNNPNPYYLRFAVADQLTASGFRNSAPASGQAVTAHGIPDPVLRTSGVAQKQYHARVTVTNLDLQFLPVYQRLSATQKLDGSWLFDNVGDQVYSARSNTKGKTYEFDYLATEYSPAALNTAGPIEPTSSIRQYAQVPQQQPQVVIDRVTDLVKGKATEYERVRAILKYFSAENGFTYALYTKPGSSASELENFLNNKQGYCQQYAVAMAWMVRTAGYPARVAFGFNNGGTRQGEAMSLTQKNLHAWTEVYFPGFGWVPFDPTPKQTGSAKTDWAPDADAKTPSTGSDPGGSATGPDVSSSNDTGLAPHDPRDRDSGTGTVADTRKPAPAWPWYLLGGVVALLVLAALPALRRSALRRRRGSAQRPVTTVDADASVPAGQMAVVVSPAVAVRKAHAAWDELLDILIDYRVPITDAYTPRVVARRVSRELSLSGAQADALTLLGQAEEQARYARTPTVPGNLGTALRAVRRAVALTATRRVRLRAMLFPPSVVQRWRARAGTAGAALANRTGRIGEGLTGTLSPRRLLPRRSR